jgi:hypothetical protein
MTANDNDLAGLNLGSLSDHPDFLPNVTAAIEQFKDFTMEQAGRLPTPDEMSKLIRQVVQAHTPSPGGLQ